MFGRCTDLVLWLAHVQPATVLPPSTLLLGRMLPVFLYGWQRDSLLCYPPLHYCWGRCCTCFIRLAARSSTVLPRPTLLVGQNAARFFFYTVGCAILYCATPSYTTVGRPFTVLSPHSAPRLNAACFGAMSVGVLGDPSLCYPSTLHLG